MMIIKSWLTWAASLLVKSSLLRFKDILIDFDDQKNSSNIIMIWIFNNEYNSWKWRMLPRLVPWLQSFVLKIPEMK